jgi:hypothetical protein
VQQHRDGEVRADHEESVGVSYLVFSVIDPARS